VTTTPLFAAPRRSILTGLLGQGVKPSLTPEMHEREAERQGIRYVYKIIDLADHQVSDEHLRTLLEFAIEFGFDGLNVTYPIKQAMVGLMDRVAPQVEAIGALNTVLLVDGKTIGHNTDVTGFGHSFREGLPGVSLDEIVLLGAGGAGTAVAHALVELGAKRIMVCDPDKERAEALAGSVTRLGAGVDAPRIEPDDLEGALREASGLVNATPIGMAAHPGMPVGAELLRRALWVADIVYRPLVTPLLQSATDLGCRTLSGAGMAVHQAADAFELITGRPADRKAMGRDFDDMVEVENNQTQHGTSPARDTSAERNQ